MTRSFLNFSCESSTLHATLDAADASTGLLIVSGGNEIRAGAWAGQAWLAAGITAHGHPVFRFDRRGVGDSDGPNLGYRQSGSDIAAAIAAFRVAQPQLTRIVALGNCDAASALMLAEGAGADALILCNPWIFENDDGSAASPAPALRAHYRQRLGNRAALRRLLTGKVALPRLFGGLRHALSPTPETDLLTDRMARGLTRFSGPVTLLIAERDRTGQAFLGAWNKRDPRLRICPGATHSFVEPDARLWLEAQVLSAMRS